MHYSLAECNVCLCYCGLVKTSKEMVNSIIIRTMLANILKASQMSCLPLVPQVTLSGFLQFSVPDMLIVGWGVSALRTFLLWRYSALGLHAPVAARGQRTWKETVWNKHSIQMKGCHLEKATNLQDSTLLSTEKIFLRYHKNLKNPPECLVVGNEDSCKEVLTQKRTPQPKFLHYQTQTANQWCQRSKHDNGVWLPTAPG